MNGRSDISLTKLGLEKNDDDRIVMPTDGLWFLLAVLFERYGIGDSTGRLKVERT
jgi:hypothetical protein